MGYSRDEADPATTDEAPRGRWVQVTERGTQVWVSLDERPRCLTCGGVGHINYANREPLMSEHYREVSAPCPACTPAAAAVPDRAEPGEGADWRDPTVPADAYWTVCDERDAALAELDALRDTVRRVEGACARAEGSGTSPLPAFIATSSVRAALEGARR